MLVTKNSPLAPQQWWGCVGSFQDHQDWGKNKTLQVQELESIKN
jgi:hypothetical protein